MKTILLLSIPPLAGAVIGFVTNVIAIKMLFRPLKEIRLFGLRLPFTPGILPRQRHKLADSIGAMVERELLTADIIRQRLQREDVREGIKNSVSRYTEKFLSLPLEVLLEPAPYAPFKDLALSVFRDFVSSPVYNECIAIFSGSLADSFLTGDLSGRSFNDIVGAEQGGKLTALVEDVIGKELVSEAEVISSNFIAAAEQGYPRAAERLIRFLNRRTVREQMEDQGRIFLTNVILKLNVFQRLFISTGQYDKTLHERMPEIIDDLIVQLEAFLEDAETRRNILRWGQETICQMFSEGPPAQRAACFFSRMLGRQMDKPIGGFLRNPGGGEMNAFIGNCLGRIKNAVLSKTEDEHSGLPFFFSLFSGKLRKRYGKENLSRILSIGPEKKAALDTIICDTIFRVADEQTGAALGAIDVRTMVSERIDSLDMIRVERIILDVMANQLKWIDAFGALLGFLIGLFQAFFSWLLR
jgi:uncharacterized membrane protein YheB (UPF0754 family)